MLGRAGGQLALLVLGRIGLGARIDKAPATSDLVKLAALQTIILLARVKTIQGLQNIFFGTLSLDKKDDFFKLRPAYEGSFFRPPVPIWSNLFKLVAKYLRLVTLKS